MNYEECQKKSGLQKGDIVKIIRHPMDQECGWRTCWADMFSKKFPIGGRYKIIDIEGDYGIRIEKEDLNTIYIPYFCLELIERPYNLSRSVCEGQVWDIPDTGKYIVVMVGYEHPSPIFRLVGVSSGNRLSDEYNSLSKIKDLLIKRKAIYLGQISDFII